MTTTLLDLINEADLIDVDGNSIRYFGLDEDGMLEAVEDGEENAIVLHIEMTDENYDKWEYMFSYKELKEATRRQDGSWDVKYTDQDWPLIVTVYKITKLETL